MVQGALHGVTQVKPAVGREREPHVPVGRLEDGSWVYAPYGAMLKVEAGRRVVCHACGEALAAISAQHARRHGLTLAGYRERFGLNRKRSLTAPDLAEKRRVEGQRRWAQNTTVRNGLAVGHQMARSGVLYQLGAAAQPAGARRPQGRTAASQEGASAALRADRERRSRLARARWAERAHDLGFAGLDDYLWCSGAPRARPRTGCAPSSAVAARPLFASLTTLGLTRWLAPSPDGRAGTPSRLERE